MSHLTEALWLLLIVPVVLGFAVQQRVKEAFERYRAVPNHAGVTGAEVARALLDAHGLQRVGLQLLPGMLTDQYDPERHVVGLSEAVARERSVASIGIAAHEVSHVYQDAEGNRAYRLRQVVAGPIAKLAPFSGVAFFGGYWLGISALVVLSLVYACGLLVFAVATVPVEVGASRRAMVLLRRAGLVDDREAKGVRRVLQAAAGTYVVGVLQRLGYFLVLVALAEVMLRTSR